MIKSIKNNIYVQLCVKWLAYGTHSCDTAGAAESKTLGAPS